VVGQGRHVRPASFHREQGLAAPPRLWLMDPLEGRGGAKTPEQEVADILPLEVDPVVAQRVLGEVPSWFHTFELNRAEGIYTLGGDGPPVPAAILAGQLRHTARPRRGHLRWLLRVRR